MTMILNQVARVFTMKGRNKDISNNDRRRSNNLLTSIFRRKRSDTLTTTIAIIDNEVENNKDDKKPKSERTTTSATSFSTTLEEKNGVDIDDDGIVSDPLNSTTNIEFTPSSTPRCGISKSTSSKKNRKQRRPDDITSLTIPDESTLFMPLDDDDNNHNDDNDDDDLDSTSLTIPHISTLFMPLDDDNNSSNDDENDDDDLDTTIYSCFGDDEADSRVHAPAPVPFVEVPTSFKHADGLVVSSSQTPTQDNNDIQPSLLMNRPPLRFGDWDDHTIESDPDDVLLPDKNGDTRNSETKWNKMNSHRRFKGTTASTRKIMADRRKVRRAVLLSQNFLQLSSSSKNVHSNRNSNSNNSNDESSSTLPPRVVKWNMNW